MLPLDLHAVTAQLARAAAIRASSIANSKGKNTSFGRHGRGRGPLADGSQKSPYARVATNDPDDTIQNNVKMEKRKKAETSVKSSTK